ncbi:MAG: hypothetical protein JRN43_01925 [Nitrososphaerota archaeon]|nr:hypothetical protein [Nitrososphaerota archaeon]MDG7019053.1 hypothetical protein [Nitrososphaerota archaeon]
MTRPAPDEIEAVSLRMPRAAVDFCKFMAAFDGMDFETYMLQGIKDLIIGELQNYVELLDPASTGKADAFSQQFAALLRAPGVQAPAPEDELKDRAEFEEHLVLTKTRETLAELDTAPQVADALGLREFLVEPHHSSGWDLDYHEGDLR